MDRHEGFTPVHRVHGVEDGPLADQLSVLKGVLDGATPVLCRACGEPITIDPHEGAPLWRRAWPTLRCETGCTCLEGLFHVNLWPDI